LFDLFSLEPGLHSHADAATNSVTLKSASDFEKIANKDQRAVALFEEAGSFSLRVA
jgi:hypothetical protein